MPVLQFVYLEVNKRCNLRCTHCRFWQRNDDASATYLSLERIDEIAEELSELNPLGRIVICGGEPMLDLERYLGFAQAGRRHGLRVLSVVNGTRIRTPAQAERVVLEGPHEISISLDDWRPEVHDELRGVRGSFGWACDAVRLLVDARARTGAAVRVNVMGLVHARNQDSLVAFHELVLGELGADKLKLNVVQPTFGGDADGGDAFFAEHCRMDPDVLEAELKRADERFGLGLNPAWLDTVRDYVLSVRGAGPRGDWSFTTRTVICNAADRDVMVDHVGHARLCFSNAFPGLQLDRKGDLRRLWEQAEQWRPRMRECKRLCGISHSVRREPTTLEGVETRRRLALAR